MGDLCLGSKSTVTGGTWKGKCCDPLHMETCRSPREHGPWKVSHKLSLYLESFRQDVDCDLGSRPGDGLAVKVLKGKLGHLDAV